jgi:hypothetical protein
MDRDALLVRAADAVLRHWPDDQAVQAAAAKGLRDADDLELADAYAFALVLVREELGEAAVRHVRARHARRTA